MVFTLGPLDSGGTELQVASVAMRLRRLGVPVVVFALGTDGDVGRLLREAGVLVVGGVPKSTWRTCTRFRRCLFLIEQVASLRRLVRRLRPCVIQAQLPSVVGLTWLGVIRLPTGVIVSARRSLNHYRKTRPFTAWLERMSMRRSDALIANAEVIARELADEGHAVPVSTIPNLLDMQRFAGDRENGPGLRLVIVANLIPYKGHADLIHALAIAGPSFPPEWTLEVIGRDDGIGASLELLAREHGVAEHILWSGSCSDVERRLRRADILVSSSHEEGTSNAILEGMAAGLAIVATAVGGTAEALGDAGVLVPPRDPRAMAAALSDLAQDPRRISELGRRSRQRVRRRHAPPRCLAAHLRLWISCERRRRCAV